jgi:DNA polymerase-2
MNECTGWLLDVYADSTGGDLVIWFLDDQGERRRLRQVFPVTFYAAGPGDRLRALWSYLATQPVPLVLDRVERRDLFLPRPLTVLKVQVDRAAAQPALFQRTVQNFPDLDYYDADLPILARYAAAHDIFPLTRCRFQFDEQGWIQAAAPLDSRWELDTEPPPLRVLEIEPDCDPFHALPGAIFIRYGRCFNRLSCTPARASWLRWLVLRYDRI